MAKDYKVKVLVLKPILYKGIIRHKGDYVIMNNKEFEAFERLKLVKFDSFIEKEVNKEIELKNENKVIEKKEKNEIEEKSEKKTTKRRKRK